MYPESQSLENAPSIPEAHTTIQTTLYDLIEAVNETVITDDEPFVTEIVTDMLIVGHAEYQNDIEISSLD